jgi:hypothetical protein
VAEVAGTAFRTGASAGFAFVSAPPAFSLVAGGIAAKA